LPHKIPGAKAGLQLRREMFQTLQKNFTYPVSYYDFFKSTEIKTEKEIKTVIAEINRK